MSKFQGIAFWTVSTLTDDWMDRAQIKLEPIVDEGIGVVQRKVATQEEVLTVTLGNYQHQIIIRKGFKAGSGEGLVRPGVTAGAFVVCLSALRRSVGDIEIVDDAHHAVPTLPRQSSPAYAAGDWNLTVLVAKTLGMMPKHDSSPSYVI